MSFDRVQDLRNGSECCINSSSIYSFERYGLLIESECQVRVGNTPVPPISTEFHFPYRFGYKLFHLGGKRLISYKLWETLNGQGCFST